MARKWQQERAKCSQAQSRVSNRRVPVWFEELGEEVYKDLAIGDSIESTIDDGKVPTGLGESAELGA